MDLKKQRIVNLAALKADPASADLAYAMAGEMDDEKWEKLRHVYLHLKQYWTEHTDWDRFDELMTRFPDGTMTSYREILPYAEGGRAKPTLMVFYDYQKPSTHTPEYSGDSRISEQELMGSLKQASMPTWIRCFSNVIWC